MGDDGARQLSPLFARRLIRPDRQSGGFQLNLSSDDRAILRHLVPQFTALLDDPTHPSVQRLFPPAYSDPADAGNQEEYRRLMSEDLAERHRAELELIASTSEAKVLSQEELMTWTRAINSIRLVLGTYLDVGEDDGVKAPTTPEEGLYRWLTYLQGEAIEALEGQT